MAEGGRHQNVRVFYDRVLVRRTESRVSYSDKADLKVPDQFRRKPLEGDVLAVDPEGRYFEGLGFLPTRVQPGDHVIFGTHAGTEVELLDGTLAFVVREDEIIGTVDQPADDANRFGEDAGPLEPESAA